MRIDELPRDPDWGKTRFYKLSKHKTTFTTKMSALLRAVPNISFKDEDRYIKL
jgi:hypothetical protein